MNYFYIYAIIYPNSNKKPKNVWYSPHLFVPLQTITGTMFKCERRCDIVGKTITALADYSVYHET